MVEINIPEEYLTCQDCGTQDKTVIETHCPYAKEINDEHTTQLN